jgi:hypothetical protein
MQNLFSGQAPHGFQTAVIMPVHDGDCLLPAIEDQRFRIKPPRLQSTSVKGI